MASLVARNIVKFIVLMFAVSVVTFVLVGISPIDPVQANVGQSAYASMSEDQRADLARYWGTGTPLFERYINWASAFIQGDMGASLRFNAPVSEVLINRSLNTLALMALAWVLSGIFGLVMGVVAGIKQGTLIDRIIKGYCFVLASTPTFWLALIVLMVFAVWLGWFPIGFSAPIGKSAADITIVDSLHHIILPALTLSVVGVANVALHTREKTIDIMESDYIRFAQARGMTRLQAAKKHGLRNLALPAISLQFASISEIFGGSVLVEQVFSYPGLGQAAVNAGVGSDVALLVGITLVSAAIVFGGNLIANILYRVIDPRIKRRGDAL